MSATATAAPRTAAGFGGLVPSAALARGGGALVAALAVELHAEGAAIPMVVLSEAPGVLSWDVGGGLEVRDDAGREYRVTAEAHSAGLGVLEVTAWITPAPPPEARRLDLVARDLERVSGARGGGGVRRQLPGGPWELSIDLVPPRTVVEAPPDTGTDIVIGLPTAVPARALSAFVDLVPIGQARLSPGGAVCLWALERYEDRAAVLTLATLGDPVVQPVSVWDDRGIRYAAGQVAGAAGEGWSETKLEIAPPIDARASRLAVRLGTFTFALALPGPEG